MVMHFEACYPHLGCMTQICQRPNAMITSLNNWLHSASLFLPNIILVESNSALFNSGCHGAYRVKKTSNESITPTHVKKFCWKGVKEALIQSCFWSAPQGTWSIAMMDATGKHRTGYPKTWWRHQMETFSALLAICTGNSPVNGEFPAQRPVTRSFDVFFDLNKRLGKQSWGWWFETPSRPLWRSCLVVFCCTVEMVYFTRILQGYLTGDGTILSTNW